MNYDETVAFLYDQLPVYQKYGSVAIKKDLDNIKALCTEMANPQNSFKSIHVAGTNGKGTVSHLLASVFQKAGYSVGLYTSPHYTDFRERIKVNGQWIDEKSVVNYVEKYDSIIRSIVPSFFEITVAMAFEYFEEQNVDIAIIEVGLGGRLDSTNIIVPEVSVITHISLDHMSMLGNNVYEISAEKAGIIKNNIPTVVGRYQPECDSVFMKKANEMSSLLSFASLDWQFDNGTFHHTKSEESIHANIDLHAESPFFIENVITMLDTIRVYNENHKDHIDNQSVSHGIEDFRITSNYIGRWQKVNDRPLAIADSAHNEDALRKVSFRLKAMDFHRLHIVVGFVKEKDISSLLSLLPHEAIYYFVAPDIFRAFDVNELSIVGHSLGLSGQKYRSVADGYKAALEAADSNDLIFIGGSSFVVGNLLQELYINPVT